MNTVQNDTLGELQAALRSGVRAALIALNHAGPYRFTAMYRFDDPTARNLYFYDRENPDVEVGDDQPVEVTYCVYVRESGEPFVMEDAATDPRVTAESRADVKSYCGVPLCGVDGHTLGTLCHFDLVPVHADPEHVARMELLARLLARS